jgi:hypothetical protein
MDQDRISPRTIALAACLVTALALPVTAPAAEGATNPLRFDFGANGSYLQATLGVDYAYFSQHNSWYGADRQLFGTDIDSWSESLIRPGLEGHYILPGSQTLYGRIDAVQANTFGGVDAGGTNTLLGDVSWLGIDKAYAGWRSGTLFGSLGDDFLDLSFGRQVYATGTSFLFGSEGGAGFRRAAYYLGGRKSADYAAIARIHSGPWSGDFFYFENNSLFPFNTTAGGGTVEYAFTPATNIGGSVAAIESDVPSRDGMRVADLRGSVKPFELGQGPPLLQPLKIEAELVREDRTDAMEDGTGWYVAASYQFAQAPWKPELTYRYASFDEHYDTLFYSAVDWGSWFQGEITGEYDLFNTNLDSHMLRLKMLPVESLAANLLYYRFSLHRPEAFGVASDDYVDEWNLIFDWTVNKHLLISLVGAYAVPDDGAKELYAGDEEWTAMMLMASVRY